MCFSYVGKEVFLRKKAHLAEKPSIFVDKTLFFAVKK